MANPNTRSIAVGMSADKYYVFTRGSADGELYWHDFDAPLWVSLGGPITSDPSCATQANGVVDVFFRGTDGALWTTYTTDAGSIWSTWTKIGGQLLDGTGPAAYYWGTSRLGCFITGTNRAVSHVWLDKWNAPHWESLGGPPGQQVTSSPAVAALSEEPYTKGRITVFIRGTDRTLWARSYNNYDPPGWNNWTSLGGTILAGTAPGATGLVTLLNVFITDTNGGVSYQGEEPNAPVKWSVWRDIGPINPFFKPAPVTSSPSACSRGSIMSVWVRRSDNSVWEIVYDYFGKVWDSWHERFSSTP
jgi:hypothetical protein